MKECINRSILETKKIKNQGIYKNKKRKPSKSRLKECINRKILAIKKIKEYINEKRIETKEWNTHTWWFLYNYLSNSINEVSQ